MLNFIQEKLAYFIKATEGEWLWAIFKVIGIGGIGYLAKFISDYFGRTKKYTERNSATGKMLNDIERSKYLNFYGISNISLEKYLDDVFVETKNKLASFHLSNSKLPWQDIEVCFASDDIGIMWEGNNYTKNIVNVVLNLSILISEHKNIISDKLENVRFAQSSLPVSFGGSMFLQSRRFKFYFKKELQIIYMVAQIKNLHSDTKKSMTLRLTDSLALSKNSFSYYKEQYNLITQNSKTIFSLNMDSKNYWNWPESIDKWTEFEKNYSVYKNIMTDFIEFSQIKDEQTILELGSGTGFLSIPIAKKNPNGKLVLLDSSPLMIKKAQDIFRNERISNTSFIVADVKMEEMLYGEYKKCLFDTIYTHFSFHHFLDERNTIFNFARKVKRYLKVGGTFSFFLHNRQINTTNLQANNLTEDPIRKLLIQIGRDRNIPLIINETHSILQRDKIITEFKDAGFELLNIEEKTYQRTINDRIAMWKTPSIMGSLLQINRINYQSVANEFDALSSNFENAICQPTSILLFRFQCANE